MISEFNLLKCPLENISNETQSFSNFHGRVVNNHSLKKIDFHTDENCDKTDSFKKLPNDLHKVIFKNLEIDSLLSLRQVCKFWGTELNDDQNHLFFKIIDIRKVSEFTPLINRYTHASDARIGYRNFRAVVNLVGGFEKYRALPEVDLSDTSNEPDYSNFSYIDITPSALPSAISRIKNRVGVVFKHYNTINKGKVTLGYIVLQDMSICNWAFSLGENFFEIRMKRENGPYDIDPSLENEMNDLIFKPMRILRKLFSRPAATLEQIKNRESFVISTSFKAKLCSGAKYYKKYIILCNDKTIS